MMKIQEILEKKKWEERLEDLPNVTFLQSWEWGDFMKKGLEKNIYRLEVQSDGGIIGLAQVAVEFSRFGKFAYLAGGPVLDWQKSEQCAKALKLIINRIREDGVNFIRMDPRISTDNEEVLKIFKTLGFVDSIKPIQVERAWILDISAKNEESLLRSMESQGMSSKVPKYIRKAPRKGVSVIEYTGSEGFNKFISLQKELSMRKNMVLAEGYFKKQFEYLVPGLLRFFAAELDDRVVATALVAMFSKEISYLHGASSPRTGDTGASYYLHWKIMEEARKVGVTRYNFWGVVQDKDFHPGHPGYGYSFFKKRFGGRVEEYIRTQEYPVKKLPYSLFRLQERYRLWKLKGTY